MDHRMGAFHSHVSGLFARRFITAGPDVFRWNRSLSEQRAWIAQDSATGFPVLAYSISPLLYIFT